MSNPKNVLKRLANIERIAEYSRGIASEELESLSVELSTRCPDVFDEMYGDIEDLLRRIAAMPRAMSQEAAW
jgi:hypothetical protein